MDSCCSIQRRSHFSTTKHHDRVFSSSLVIIIDHTLYVLLHARKTYSYQNFVYNNTTNIYKKHTHEQYKIHTQNDQITAPFMLYYYYYDFNVLFFFHVSGSNVDPLESPFDTKGK